MRILVCIKAVPGYVTNLRVSENDDRVNYDCTSIIINEFDEFALELAVVLKKKFGGAVTLITVGTLSSQEALSRGLAKGADKAIRVDADLADPETIATVLARAIKINDYDLILTGAESSDNMSGQVGVSIAQKLGMPYAYGVLNVNYVEHFGARMIEVTKEIGGGTRHVLEMVLPVLLCVQPDILPLGFISLRMLRDARAQPVQVLTLDELGINQKDIHESKRLRIVDVFPPPKRPGAEIIDGQLSNIAQVLIEKIKQVLR